MSNFYTMPSIGSFSKIIKNVTYHDTLPKLVTYRGKVKLHGTNAGVSIFDGVVSAQKKSATITAGPDDNCGFAEWVDQTKDFWSTVDDNVVFLGEWCGEGIQKGVGVNKIGRKVFAIFAMQYVTDKRKNDTDRVVLDPEIIKSKLGHHNDVFVLPWYSDGIEVNLSDTTSLQTAMDFFNSEVDVVEKNDPWVYDVFGVDGIGEGLVYYPVSLVEDDTVSRWIWSKYTFKAKGEKHQVIRTKKAVTLSDEMVSNIQELIGKLLPEARLEQAVSEAAKGEYDTRLLGPVIAWTNKDIKKDHENGEFSLPEEITWKMLSSAISSKTRQWYSQKAHESIFG